MYGNDLVRRTQAAPASCRPLSIFLWKAESTPLKGLSVISNASVTLAGQIISAKRFDYPRGARGILLVLIHCQAGYLITKGPYHF